MGEAQHTPTPWEVWRAPEGGAVAVRAVYHDEMGRRITCWPALCNAGGQSNEANAAFIVHAVNSHATLTAALEEARGALEASRSFVELAYEETDGEEAADAKIVMGQTDAALATINAALEGLQ